MTSWQEVLGFDMQKVFAIISVKLIFVYLNLPIFFTLNSNHNILLLVQSIFMNGEKEQNFNGNS